MIKVAIVMALGLFIGNAEAKVYDTTDEYLWTATPTGVGPWRGYTIEVFEVFHNTEKFVDGKYVRRWRANSKCRVEQKKLKRELAGSEPRVTVRCSDKAELSDVINTVNAKVYDYTNTVR